MSMPPTQLIAEWLAKIGLERCAAAFAANDIDVSVLGHLTDTDSEKMRASLGYRRKMLSQLIRGILTANSKQTGVAALFRRFTTSRPMATPGPEYPGV